MPDHTLLPLHNSNRKTDRQNDRQSNRKRQRVQQDRQAHRKTDRQRDRPTSSPTDRPRNRPTDGDRTKTRRRKLERGKKRHSHVLKWIAGKETQIHKQNECKTHTHKPVHHQEVTCGMPHILSSTLNFLFVIYTGRQGRRQQLTKSCCSATVFTARSHSSKSSRFVAHPTRSPFHKHSCAQHKRESRCCCCAGKS